MQKITQAAAEKLRAETGEKGAKAAERQVQLVKTAAVERLRLECGTMGKKVADAMCRRSSKACKCHGSLGASVHKAKCNFHPEPLRSIGGVLRTRRA